MSNLVHPREVQLPVILISFRRSFRNSPNFGAVQYAEREGRRASDPQAGQYTPPTACWRAERSGVKSGCAVAAFLNGLLVGWWWRRSRFPLVLRNGMLPPGARAHRVRASALGQPVVPRLFDPVAWSCARATHMQPCEHPRNPCAAPRSKVSSSTRRATIARPRALVVTALAPCPQVIGSRTITLRWPAQRALVDAESPTRA